MNTTLLIMAAGLGSRFGGGIKQLEAVGPNGEIIMDYSIHDAVEAGFNKIVFVIRKDIEEDFRQVIGNRIEETCARLNVAVDYVFQELDRVPAGVSVPEGRKKPWGTGQAVLAARDVIGEPFVVINADDYYGKTAFVKIHDFLCQATEPNHFCMAGFILKNTLSENGGVTRGICEVNEHNLLTNVVETSNIVRTATGAAADGTVIDENAYVSMNMWGLTPEFMDTLERGFAEFFADEEENILKKEFLLPVYIGQLLREQKVQVSVLETADKWVGVTYQEDKPGVVSAIQSLINAGVYAEKLFTDLK